MFRKQFLLFVICLFTTSIIAQNEELDSISETNYSVQFPKNWDYISPGQMGTTFMIFSPVSSKEDQFRENVNLLIQDLSTHDLSLDQYAQISEKQIKTLITNSKIIENTKLKKNGLYFQKLIYTGTQGVLKLQFEQYYWVENKQAYVLTFTTEESEFENFKTTGENILNSFVLKP